MTPIKSPKKLIEVALPLDAINVAAAREKSIRHGHPSTLHLWWARRPLAAARAVIFAQMVNDPGYERKLGRGVNKKKAEEERERLFRIIEELVQWENTNNEEVLERARAEIRRSWRETCELNKHHPQAAELFDPEKLPAFHDPFAGGGAIPLEAQRLGLEAWASDLNPVAVTINKAMIEIPPRFAGLPPVNPEDRKRWLGDRYALPGTRGLAEGDDVGQRGISIGTDVAEGRNLRDAFADHTGSDVGSGQHRGRVDARIEQRESQFSIDCTRLVGGNGDLPHALRGDRLVSEGSDHDDSQPDRGSRQDAQLHAQKTARSAVAESYELFPKSWRGAEGLAADVRRYGAWMRVEAEKRIGHLYPKIEAWQHPKTGRWHGREEIEARVLADREFAESYPLSSISYTSLTVIAWLWARTAKSPNPAYSHVEVPLASTFVLSKMKGNEAYVEPVIEGDGYRFAVRVGTPPESAKDGTKLSRGANFKCLLSGKPIEPKHIKAEGMAGRLGQRLMAIVAEGTRGRVYLTPTEVHEAIARQAVPTWQPETPLPDDPRNFWTLSYGLSNFGDLFTPRQLVALTTFSDLVQEAIEKCRQDALAADMANDGIGLDNGGQSARAYAEAVGTYLMFVTSSLVDRMSTICSWDAGGATWGTKTRNTFARQAIPMSWDFAEVNCFSGQSGSWGNSLDYTTKGIVCTDFSLPGRALQSDATSQDLSYRKIVSTDPPYYDNIGYADLSDFFYVWLRKSLRPIFPGLYATLAVPKAEELVATPYRHGSKDQAETFFLEGMTRAIRNLAEQAHPAFPVTIYYAFKQAETKGEAGTSSTGWETFLDAVIRAGFGITGTWPMRTELGNRMVGAGNNALASSIVLVCRKRPADAPTVSRREFLRELNATLPEALLDMTRGGVNSPVAPVDLSQAIIGPGMAIFSQYAAVLEADGAPMRVKTALQLINRFLAEDDFDPDTQFCLHWFEQHDWTTGKFGQADVLARAKGTSVQGLSEAGVVEAGQGQLRLLKWAELPRDWSPETDTRVPIWEALHQLIRALNQDGESAAGALLARMPARAEPIRALAYRLYTLCERQGKADDARAYNEMVTAWTAIEQAAAESGITGTQPSLDL